MQNGDGNNNFSNSGDNNNFNFSQSQDGKKSVQLTIDETQAKRVDINEVKNKTFASFLCVISTVGINALSIGSDCFGLGEKTGISPAILMAASFPLSMVPLIVNHNNITYYLRKPKSKEQSKYIGNGKLIGINDKDNYLVAPVHGPCIYPHCKGIINLTATPPREVGRIAKEFVGICSLAERDHSYIVDYNLVATRASLDWRPLEEK